jgi:hypothetical protein
MEKTEFFEGIPQTAVKVGSYNIQYPIFYRDLTYLSVFLLAPLNKVKSILPSKRMHPFRLTPWHCMVTITASQYKDSDVGPYNQVSVGIPFVLDKASPVFTGILHKPPDVPMIYTLYLPVTTEISRVAGVNMANYPEFLADIGFEKREQWIDCKVDFEGKNILRLSGREINICHNPRQCVCPVTLKDNRLLRSEFNFSESDAGVSKKQSDVLLEFGDHPIGLQMKELYLGKVLQYQYYPSGQAILSMVTESYPV